MKPWKVIFTDAALADLDAILETTLESFGTGQLKRYATQIESAIRELEEMGNGSSGYYTTAWIQPYIFRPLVGPP